MIKKLYRTEFETVLRDAPAGSIVIDYDGNVFQFTKAKYSFVLRSNTLTLKEGSYEVLEDVVSYPVMLIEMSSVEPITDDKEPTSVLDYLTKVWEKATVPEDGYIPAGSVVIHRNDSPPPNYLVWTMITATEWALLTGIRIVSSPPPEVGFYMQEKGHAYYWDGSVWRHRKGGPRSWQDYEFSAYIGDVKEDK